MPAETEARPPPQRGAWTDYLLPLAIFAAISCLRMPQIVLVGRFWAEEGRDFFHNAWALPPLAALLVSYGGYLNLVANAGPLAARWLMPLEYAPYLTIAISLAFQMCPAVLLLTARDPWLRSPLVRVAGLLLLLFVPASEEVWLQTLHCQLQLALCCGIILALDTPAGRARVFHHALLFLAPLTGLVSIGLLPLFGLRALLDRSLGRLAQVATLAAASAIQLVWFFQAVPGREYSVDAVIMLCVAAVRHVELPLFGIRHAQAMADTTKAWLAAGHTPVRAMLYAVIPAATLAAATLWDRRSNPAAWLLAAGLVVFAIGYFGAIQGAARLIDVYTGARYAFVPQALIGLSLLSLAATGSVWVGRSAGVAVIWLILVGIDSYYPPIKDVAQGPSWRREIALWRQDPTHVVRLWPDAADWTLTLGPPRP